MSYCVPHTISTDRTHVVYMRARALEKCTIRLSTPGGEYIYEKKLRYVVPAEMVNLTVRPRFLENFTATRSRWTFCPGEDSAHEQRNDLSMHRLPARLPARGRRGRSRRNRRGARLACKRAGRSTPSRNTPPQRTVATTVAVRNSSWARLPVRSSAPVPKDAVVEICRRLHAVETTAPVQMGQVIVANVLGTGADMIATRDMPLA